MNLDIVIVEGNEKSTIKLSGEIDIYTAPKLKEMIMPLTKKRNQLIEVNFGNVNYMDSTGLGAFIHLFKLSKENQSQIKLVNLQNRVARLFTITGLDEILDITSDRSVN